MIRAEKLRNFIKNRVAFDYDRDYIVDASSNEYFISITCKPIAEQRYLLEKAQKLMFLDLKEAIVF